MSPTMQKLRTPYRHHCGIPTPDHVDALRRDIKERGITDPIEVDEKNNILDGHIRYDIARELGIKARTEVRRFTNEHAKMEHLAKGRLLGSRQLGPISWARMFALLLEHRGIARGQGSSAQKRWSEDYQSATVADLAAELGVPERTARYRLQVAEDLKAHPELIAQVEKGEITVRQALLEVGTTRVTKPDLNGEGLSHPARYSEALLEVFAEVLHGFIMVLDPFAGTGLIHELRDDGFDTYGIEIEPEWAVLHEGTEVGDARKNPFADSSFDAICTSPTYGNRMADHHDARDPSTRRSYRHDLGHELNPGNSGRLQWGAKYREFHELAWQETVRVLRPKGLFVLNIKDHIRKGKRQYVSGWHVTTLCALGLELLFHEEIDMPGMRAGANGELRCPEYVYVFEKSAS